MLPRTLPAVCGKKSARRMLLPRQLNALLAGALLGLLPPVCDAASAVGLDFMNVQPGGPPGGVQPGPVGGDLLALARIDLQTGNVTRARPFFINDTANGYSCIQAFRPSPPTYYIISSFEPVRLVAVDATTGVATTVDLSEQLVVFDISWSGAVGGGRIYAYAAAPPYQAEDAGIFAIDPTTGAVGKNLGELDISGYAEPRPCESGLTASSADPRFYFTVATNKRDPDDGDQALLTYDLTQQKVVAQVPWAAKANGSLNAMLAMTLPGAAAESVLAIATDPEPREHGGRPLELLSIDPQTGRHSVLAGVPVKEGPLIPSLGSLAVNQAGSSLITVVMDDATVAFSSITFDLAGYAATGKAAALRRPLTQRSNLWNLQYVGSGKGAEAGE